MNRHEWKFELDGTWKKGVWCMVRYGKEDTPILAKVVRFVFWQSNDSRDSENQFYTDEDSHYEFAEPVEERHAKLLETIHRKESEALNND